MGPAIWRRAKTQKARVLAKLGHSGRCVCTGAILSFISAILIASKFSVCSSCWICIFGVPRIAIFWKIDSGNVSFLPIGFLGEKFSVDVRGVSEGNLISGARL